MQYFKYLIFSLWIINCPLESVASKCSVGEIQEIIVEGEVIDGQSNSPLVGVSVRLKGTNHFVVTNDRGKFEIAVQSKDDTLIFTLLGYSKREVKVSQVPKRVELNPAATLINEVSVSTTRRVNTEMALLEARRRSGIVQDGISAQQIERTASITTTQALQRVVGVTVTDEKFVAIRGLGDRNVIGQLNGTRLASSNPDRSAIPLDLVPASLLDNIIVSKTYTPDKPADAASGIIELKTKSIPDTLIFEVIAQSGFNSNIGVGGKYNSFGNSDMGFLGTKINDKNLSPEFLELSELYPNGLGSIQRLIANTNFSPETQQEVLRVNSIMQGFDQTMTTQYSPAPLNQLYSATFGNSYEVFNKHKIGLILGGNYYRRTSDIYQGDLTQWSVYQGVVTGNPDVYSWRNIPNFITPNNLYLGKYQSYQENTGIETLNYGVLGGLAYRFSPRHEISGQYFGSWGGENAATNMDGAYEYSGLPGEVHSRVHSLKQTFRNLHTYTLQGAHKFGEGEYAPELNYNSATSSSEHNDPDYRFASIVDFMPNSDEWRWYTDYRYTNEYDYNRNLLSERRYTEHLYALTSGYVNGYGPYGIIQAEPNGRRWRNLVEKNYNYNVDLVIPFSFFNQTQKLQLGGSYLFRDRKYQENHLFIPGSNYTDLSSTPLYKVDGDLDRLVSTEVVGILTPEKAQGEGGFPVSGFLYNSQKSPNNYTGYQEVGAWYGMVDLKPTEDLRVVGGVRFETTDLGSVVDTAGVFLDPSLTEQSEDGSRVPLVYTEPNSLYRTGYKPFYSINATYSLDDGRMNIRAAYNTTLARPELREITNVFEYDAFQMGLVVGNPLLRNQTSENLDFRWEWFPSSGEVLAFSMFGKRIHNQLVKVFSLKTAGLAATYPEFPAIRFENEPHTGQVWGVELEAVKDLKTILPFQGFFIGANVMLAQSNIKKSELRYEANMTLDRNTPKNSPLFEQAPYSINGWLNYNNKRLGSDFTATFNMVGERLVQINLLGEPDLYTRPVPMLDFVWSQRIHKRILFKGYVKNVLNPAIKTVYSNPGTGGLWYGNEYLNRSFKRGTEIMMGFTYNIL